MNKDKINSQIEDLEAELQKLKKLDSEYVNRAEFISDIRAALSHEDIFGDSILHSPGRSVVGSGLDRSREALRKLNIITD